MCDNNWWNSYGSFKRWSECPTRPDPGEVLLFYLQKRGIEPDEQVDYLIDLLDLHKSMVYNILKGEGLDSISRCRLLIQALKIPPPLLGLDAKYYPIELHSYWWKACGFSFNTDAQGYPLISEVIAYLRTQRTQREEGGRVKAWSQEDLADATGLKKETIYRMEHDRNPLILENMSRRALVASALGTLAGESEPTLFRLLGLAPQAYGVPLAASERIPEVHFSPPRLTDETLLTYHRQQAACFAEYFTRHAQNAVEEALEWVRGLPTLLPRAVTTAQRVSLLVLQSRNHRLLVNIAREQRKTSMITFHADEAVKLAESAVSLPDGGNKALLRMSNEVFASALLSRADASYELGWYDQAQADIDQAFNLLPLLRSSQLKRQILADAGLIHAHTAQSWQDQQQALSYFKRASSIDPHQPDEPDDNYVRCGQGMLYLRKAMALSAPNMKGATAEKVTDILEDAQRWTPPELIRQQVLIDVFQALDHFTAGEYEWATEAALSALEKSRQIRSHLNRARIEGLYQQLLDTSYRDRPFLAYLGLKLRTWEHGMG